MAIPKQYLDIKEFISGYLNMQKINASFDNREDIYNGTLTENNYYWIIVLTNTLGTRYNKNKTFSYKIYLDKYSSNVRLILDIKATYNIGSNNFLFGELIKKLNKGNIYNTNINAKRIVELLNSDIHINFNDYLYAKLTIELNSDNNLIDQINYCLDTIDKYNIKIYERLLNRYINNK